jgi:REP element-mobilizing transposase RayT
VSAAYFVRRPNYPRHPARAKGKRLPKAGQSLLVHLRWQVGDPSAAPLTPEMLARLPQYVLRYAETLGTRVLGVGGAADHVHVLLDLSPSRTLQSVEDELLRSTQRFMRDLTGSYVSVSPTDSAVLLAYIAEQGEIHTGFGALRPEWEDAPESTTPAVATAKDEDQIPEWLRSAMGERAT